MVGLRRSPQPHVTSLVTGGVMLQLERYDGLIDDAIDQNETSSLVRRGWWDLQRVSWLGQGTFSTVQMVVDPRTRIRYALKSLDARRLTTSDDLLEAAIDLARETALLAMLDHENIIQLRGIPSQSFSESYQDDDDTQNAGFFFLMDVLEETLKDRLERWRKDKAMTTSSTRRATSLLNVNHLLFSLRLGRSQNTHNTFANRNPIGALDGKQPIMGMMGRVETVALDIVRGMRYLHEEKSICLRDLKPANIGFDAQTGQVRLFDFGLARPLHECLAEKEIIGTPRYMAPEVMINRGTSFASDVYSFGIVLYEICSLQVAFANEQNWDDFRRYVVDSQGRPNRHIIPCPLLQALIAECWAKDPERRPSFAEIHQRLLEIVASTVLPTSTRCPSSAGSLKSLTMKEDRSMESTNKTYGLETSSDSSCTSMDLESIDGKDGVR